MFGWYKNSTVYLAYLEDLPRVTLISNRVLRVVDGAAELGLSRNCHDCTPANGVLRSDLDQEEREVSGQRFRQQIAVGVISGELL